MSAEQSVDARTIEETRQQLRNLVAEIASLSKEELEPQAYFAEFLPRVVTALAAHGGAVWLRGDDRRVELIYQINLRETQLAESQEKQQQHGRLLQKVLEGGEGTLVAPNSGEGDPEGAGNPTDFLLVLSPLRSHEATEGVVEIFQRPHTQPASQQGYLQFLLQMCDSAGDWIRGRKLRQFTDRQSLWAQADHFSQVVHDNLDPKATAYTIANEGRRLIGCDRVSVALMRGRRCVIEAVSGQDTFDRRSNTIVHLQNLAARVVAAGDSLWYTGRTEDLPPQLEEAIHAYVDEAHSKTVGILPLRKPTKIEDVEEGQVLDDELSAAVTAGSIIGALIIEQIEDERPRESLGRQVEMVEAHSARALSNAAEHNELFLMPLWRTLGKSRWLVRARQLPKTVAVSAAILIFAASMFIPVNFDLKASGQLQPVERQQVFVDNDGVVTEVLVEHGQLVEANAPLVTMRNTELEIQFTDVQGQLETAEQRLLTVLTEQARRTTTPQEASQLAGEAAQLKQRVITLGQQIALIQTKRDQLVVKAPIAGQVITWNVREQLEQRPVTVGQVLMTIARPDGDWELELFMPEKRMGYVTREKARIDARNKEKGTGIVHKMKVDYFSATSPGDEFYGEVLEIDKMAQLHEEEGHSVRIRVDLKPDPDGPNPEPDEARTYLPDSRRPGASVTGRVHCGRSTLGYYWFHELWEFVQAKILF